jgi:GTP-binding protein HflX
MFDIKAKPNCVERTFLIGAYFDRREESKSKELLSELKELVNTLGLGQVSDNLIFAREMNPRTLIGKGKTQELILKAKELNADCIIFDNELSPAQQRAWEQDSGLCVIDRHEVILDIFAMRARTREAQLQVELARLEYSLPRLTRMWSHLDRQGGGSGSSGGAAAARGEGETQLEVDRRLSNKKVDKLKAELEEVKQQRDTMRKERSRVPLPLAAIVGYTNAGKSSLLNHLTQAEVLAEDKLFATLDTTTRRYTLPDGQDLLLTDTVGFIRNLPHDLVQSFRATLEETTLADFIIHVIDASNAEALAHFNTTNQVLTEIGAGDKPTVLVLNKADLLTPEQQNDIQRLFSNGILISVLHNTGFENFNAAINEQIADRVIRIHANIPLHRMDLVALAHEQGKVLKENYDNGIAEIQCVIPKRHQTKFTQYLSKPLAKAPAKPKW